MKKMEGKKRKKNIVHDVPKTGCYWYLIDVTPVL